MMLLGAAFLAVPFYLAKQSQIIVYIIVGAFVQSQNYHQEMQLSVATSSALFELGILFVLFMGGMEVDLGALMKGWQVVLINGLGQIVLNIAVFAGIAAGQSNAAFKGVGAAGIIYFGICATLSSTILVLGALKKRGEMEALHGQVILGLMVMQDITAVLSIAIMPAFDPNAAGTNIGETVGFLIMWFAILLIVLAVLARFVLDPLFTYFAVTSELLFICTFAYSLGVAAFFGWFLPGWTGAGSFSQEISIFFSGVAIAQACSITPISSIKEPTFPSKESF
jgi:Kef-type K+ transport system membrane component KefB